LLLQDNERLQKEKTAAERKLQRLAHRLGLQRGAGAAIGGDTSSRVDQLERQACTAALLQSNFYGELFAPRAAQIVVNVDVLCCWVWIMRMVGQVFTARESKVAVLGQNGSQSIVCSGIAVGVEAQSQINA
jgi:hypothetical protein